MHWLQRKKPQLSARSHFFKNQEKPQKNGFLQFFRPLVAGVKHQIFISRKIFSVFLWHKAYKITRAGNLSLILRDKKFHPLLSQRETKVKDFVVLVSTTSTKWNSDVYSLLWSRLLGQKGMRPARSRANQVIEVSFPGWVILIIIYVSILVLQ